jgi:anti-sigma B factor antagonist
MCSSVIVTAALSIGSKYAPREVGTYIMASPLECLVGSLRSGEPVVVTVRGEVDLATASELESCVSEAFGGAPSAVVLDLEALTFIDSSGLRALVSLAQEATSRGATLALRNVPSHAQRVLDLTGLAKAFPRADEP